MSLNNITLMSTDIATVSSTIATTTTAMSGYLTTAFNDITALESLMTTAGNDITALESDMTSASNDITALESSMTTAGNNITALQSNVTNLTSIATFTVTPSAVGSYPSYTAGKFYFVITPNSSGVPVDSASTWIGISASKLYASINGVLSAVHLG